MPAKGSKFRLGKRDYVFNKKFYEEHLVAKHGIQLSHDECKNIIETCSKQISKVVVDEIDGFKLPFGLGYLCAGKFMPSKPPINWEKTRAVGKKVYHLNFHTLGYCVRSYWFRVGRIANARFHEVFKFESYKTLAQSISKAFNEGKPYAEWSVSDFIEKGRLENFYNKEFRKEQKE